MRLFEKILRYIILLGGACLVAACAAGPRTASLLPSGGDPVAEHALTLQVLNDLGPKLEFPKPRMKPPVPLLLAPASGPLDLDLGVDEPGIRIDPETLLGFSEQQVSQLLGPAVERVKAPPSRVMRYRFPDCRVTVYLFASLRTGDYQVLYSQIDPAADQPEPEGHCFVRTALRSMPGIGSM